MVLLTQDLQKLVIIFSITIYLCIGIVLLIYLIFFIFFTFGLVPVLA